MREFWRGIGAESGWGPGLCALGAAGFLAGAWIHGWRRQPTILGATSGAADRAPTFWERVSLHLVIYPGWALGFGLVVWRGVPPGLIDVRFEGEKSWPVLQGAEWIYLSSYVVPLVLPWVVHSRAGLRRYALDLWWVLLGCIGLFLTVPVGAPPRSFAPDSLAGNILAWETGRPDFAAASWPSFHVCWALLCARLLATRGPTGAWLGWSWAGAVAFSCVANGAHAVADVVAAGGMFLLVTAAWSPLRRALAAAE
ncbi:MAG: phosphatase PAP2 family protein [Verrucomicrobia bacterium]|nr:phosphatase PAP2 family protein [Verrucomicrobiota bacterium]